MESFDSLPIYVCNQSERGKKAERYQMRTRRCSFREYRVMHWSAYQSVGRLDRVPLDVYYPEGKGAYWNKISVAFLAPEKLTNS